MKQFTGVVLVLAFALVAHAGAVTSPAEYLGHAVGADFELVDWKQCSDYYRKLAEQSPNVKLNVEGKTTEGRDFLIVAISSQSNLSNLAQLKAFAATIADPRGTTPQQRDEAINNGKVFITITPAMHSVEVGGTQFAMQFAYDLATSDAEPWRSTRENAVVILCPNLNPDGLDHVCEWYRKTVKTKYETSPMLKLYQYYTGHDNNRDFFMLTQAETKIISRVMYYDWRPQIHWDVHQQGNSAERMFVPPFRDPLNANIDPAIVAATNLIGSRAVLDMTREGLTGIAQGCTYDNWSGTGNRGIPSRHNMVAILTELSAVNIASPVFQKFADLKPVHGKEYGPSNQYVNPWPGGWWRLSDIINYELAFGRSLLGTINREPKTWLRNVLEANIRTIEAGRGEGVRGWIIPSDERDPSAVRRMVDALIQTGTEVHVTDGEVKLDGRTYPAGTIIIRRDQPWAGHVKDLFEMQRYPKGSEPYDVAGWSLPPLMGVRRVEVMQSLDEVAMKLAKTADDAVAAFKGDPRAVNGFFSSADSKSWSRLVELLKENKRVTFVTKQPYDGLFTTDQSSARGIAIERLPRIGIYAQWSGNMDEGWMRWLFDTWKIPYVTVRNEQLRAGKLGEFLDVLIIPGTSPVTLDDGRALGTVHEQYTGGLAPEGSAAVEDFVRGGGTLITVGAASKWAIELFDLPLTDVITAATRPSTGPASSSAEEEHFSCPGSILRSIPEPHALTAGLPESIPLMFASNTGWRDSRKGDHDVKLQTLLRYAKTQLLLSGYINKPQTIAGHAAWVRGEIGKGRVHLFAFQPHYRSWSQGTFGLLFRAVLLDAPEVSTR
jgi:hypothetical protein